MSADLPAAAVARLRADLEWARAASSLPDAPTARAALDELLVRIRLAAVGETARPRHQ
jgi:hypothetical protein